MKRKIINHWTAGGFTPNKTDFQHYHYLIDCGGKVYKGVYPVSANDVCTDGNYAAHTGGGNTGKIGVAVCGMAGFVSPQKPGNYKLTKIQLEKLFELNAKLLIQEGWNEANDVNLLTHYEYGKKYPETSSAGKIDITFLPPYPHVLPDITGEFIRGKTNWYMQWIASRSLY
ncbi:MAG: N-acetylmuramoyl-L-alanine amidase [Bacteroidota bacterium]